MTLTSAHSSVSHTARPSPLLLLSSMGSEWGRRIASWVCLPFILSWRLIALLRRLLSRWFIEGRRLALAMRKSPEYVPVALYAAAALLIVPTGFVPGWDRAWWYVGAAFVFAFATVLLYARYVETRALERGEQRAVARAQTEHRLELQKLLGFDLHNLLNVIAEVLTESDPGKRRELARKARRTAVCMTANLVGKSAGNGTRANLYRLNYAKTAMSVEPGAFYGRGDRSMRIFTEEDDTFNEIMRNEVVFEDFLPKADHQKYRTYIAHPVSIGGSNDGPLQIYGALTVDCPGPDDLDPKVDVAKVAVFSTLIAATYEC
jgi:hypothetical protein